MKHIQTADSALSVPSIGMGCMRIADMPGKEVQSLIHSAMDCGVNFFDHADIYGDGRCEEVFAQNCDLPRDKIIIQTKCGIRRDDGPTYYDFSKDYILSCVDKSLKRLNTDYIDILLLHRPDALMEPEEVAEAFKTLHSAGKVRHFGVSNQNPGQMAFLQRALGQRLLFNQLQMSVMHTGMIDAGINVNTAFDGATVRDGGILNYCQFNDVVVQAWSPFQYGFFEGVFLGSEKFPELNQALNETAEAHNTSATTIAAAWLLRHPAKIQVIPGTTNAARLNEVAAAADVTLTKREWYAIYRAAGNQLP